MVALKSRLLKQGGVTAVFRAVSLVAGFIAAVVLARVLGINGLGSYSAIIAVLTIFSLPLEFGLPALITREVARGKAADNSGETKGLIRFSFGFIILCFPLLAGCALLAISYAPWAGDITATPLWWMMLPYVFFSGAGSIAAAFLSGRHLIITAQFSGLVLRPLIFLSILWMWHSSPGQPLSSVSAVWAQTLATAIASSVCLILCFLHFYRSSNDAPPQYAITAWIQAAWKLGLVNGIRRSQPQMLIYLLSLIGSLEAVGLLRVAQRGASLVAFGATVVTTTTMPYISSMIRGGDISQLQKVLHHSARLMSLWAGVCFIAALLLGSLAIAVVFGQQYSQAYWPFILFCLVELIKSYYGMTYVVLNMAGYEATSLRLMAVNLVVSLIGTLLLAPTYGALGCAIAFAVATCLAYVLASNRALALVGVRTSLALGR